jgi:hypothetical protein
MPVESFLDVSSDHAVAQISLKQGETRVVRLKKFDAGQPVDGHPGLYLHPKVVVSCENPSVAFCFHVSKLGHNKKAYDDHYDVNQVDTALVEKDGFYYFQICGKQAGTTQLTAVNFSQAGSSGAFASSIPVSVSENKKRLYLHPNVPFSSLWDKHPLRNPNYKAPAYTDPKDKTGMHQRRSHPCPINGFEQCMVRVCTALTEAGVSLNGLTGWHCPGAGSLHKHHFVQPYDFPKWQRSSFYVWEAKPHQPEPMPGMAAWAFMLGRKGVVLFQNYFTNFGSMTGGHIDLWNTERMGNNWSATNPNMGEGLSAFFRSQKIYFWPLD